MTVTRGQATSRVVRTKPGGQRLGAQKAINASSDVLAMALARRDSVQGDVLRKWLERDLPPAFVTRVLPVDLTVARRASERHVRDPRPERDVVIAATALSLHYLVVVTRNIAGFQPLGVELLNPWDR